MLVYMLDMSEKNDMAMATAIVNPKKNVMAMLAFSIGSMLAR